LYYSRYTNKPWPCPNGQVWVPNVTSGLGIVFDDRQQHCKTVNGVFSCINEKWTDTAPLATHPWLVNLTTVIVQRITHVTRMRPALKTFLSMSGVSDIKLTVCRTGLHHLSPPGKFCLLTASLSSAHRLDQVVG